MNQFREYKSDEAKLKVYGHRITTAQAKLDEWEPQATAWVRRYETKPNSKQYSGNGHHVAVPTAVSIIDSLYSSLTATDVTAMVSAIGQGTRKQEQLATAAVGKEWDMAKVNPRAAQAVKDALLVGIGWVKVSYEYHSEVVNVPRTDEEVNQDVSALIAEAEQYGHDIDATQIANLVPLTKNVENVLVERIVCDYVPWNRVLWDPAARQMQDVRWVAQVDLLHPEEVKNHPSYKAYCAKNKTAKKLAELASDSVIDLGLVQTGNTEDERCTIITLYDFETGTVCVFPKNGDFLLDETPNVFAMNDDLEDKSPFVPLVLRQSPGRVRGVSEMEVLNSTLEEMDLYHSRLATYLERMAPKFIGPKGAFTDSGLEALKSQEYFAYAELENGVSASDVSDLKPPVLPSEIFGVSDKLEQSAREATGVNELMRGLFPDRKRTATETSEVVQSSAARQAEKRVQLEHFYSAIAHRILQLMQMFYTEERIVRYTDEAGPVEWKWTADDIIFEHKLEIALTPKEVRNWQTRRDDALAVLNILGPLAQPGDAGNSVVDQTELVKYVLEELGLSQSTIALLLNLPEEQQIQQMAALQSQAAQAGAQQAGVPNAAMVPGPLNEAQLAAATNQGTIPPETLAAAYGNTPVSPQAVETVSENAGQPA
jgi:hypothetical protein